VSPSSGAGQASGLGVATEALVTAAFTARTREGDRVVLDTPARRDFWFGHGFVLDAPPDAARIGALIEEGRARFTALGASRFVVQWERACDAPDVLPDPPDGTLRDRTVMLRYDGPVPEPDPRVVDHDDSRWAHAAALATAQYPEQGAYTGWRFGRMRHDTACGRARSVGVRDGGELLNTATLYRGETLARFATPVTRPDARGRGLFSACARTLIAWANEGALRTVVIAAEPDGGLIPLYRRLGFVPMSHLDAVIVPARG
jgi:GNAT superfamily N-acetyltransferase